MWKIQIVLSVMAVSTAILGVSDAVSAEIAQKEEKTLTEVSVEGTESVAPQVDVKDLKVEDIQLDIMEAPKTAAEKSAEPVAEKTKKKSHKKKKHAVEKTAATQLTEPLEMAKAGEPAVSCSESTESAGEAKTAEPAKIVEADIASRYSFDGDIVHFSNPFYAKYPKVETATGFKTLELVDIPNGSLISFAASGPIGRAIRLASSFNGIQNPYGLTHSGIIFNDDPVKLTKFILRISPGGKIYRSGEFQISYEVSRAILNQLMDSHRDVISATHCPSVKAAFTIESNGSAEDVLKGMYPHVHIYDLATQLKNYSGNVFIRPLNKAIPASTTREFIKKYIGRSYESSISGFAELARAVRDINSKSRTENVFCSELAALFYQESGLLSKDIVVSNVIPEELSVAAGENGDILKGIAKEEIPLKVQYDFSSDMHNACGCFSSCIFPKK